MRVHREFVVEQRELAGLAGAARAVILEVGREAVVEEDVAVIVGVGVKGDAGEWKQKPCGEMARGGKHGDSMVTEIRGSRKFGSMGRKAPPFAKPAKDGAPLKPCVGCGIVERGSMREEG